MKEQYSLPVYSTEDYKIFKKLHGNRDLYPKHARRLVKILEKDPLFTKKNPIKVNEKFQIIDGQHRLAAFEEFAKRTHKHPPLYYVVVEGANLEDARAMNALSKAWTPRDYAEAYAFEGKENYKTYLSFAKKFDVQHNVLARYLSSNKDTKNFRDGGFVADNSKEAKRLLSQLLEVGPMYVSWPSQSFSMAFYQIATSRMYDHEQMVRQMKSYKEALNSVPARISELLPAINMVYNFKRKQQIDLLKR